MALKIIKTSNLEEILTCNDESFLTITQKINEDNFISNKMQIKNLPLNNYYKKTDIDELLKTYSKTTHNHDFNSLSNLPTTLSGYGITDAYTKTEIDNKNYLTNQDITGKQDKLKAGTNITISDDNTISANGVKINDTKKDTTTTYSSSKIETIKSELQQSIDNVSAGGSTALTNYYTKAESDDKYSLATHKHTISDITNLQTTLDKKAPVNYVSQFEGGAISSNFRKTIIGTTDMCGFAKSFRKNDSTDACMPQYGSGIAWGQADTHGMLYVDYINPTAYVAGGNGNKLNWYKQIAWKDDLTSYSLKTHNHDTVYSKLGHTHNYAGSSTAGGPATSAITSNFTGIKWTTPTQVGTWSALCKFNSYSSIILSIYTNQNTQCGLDTFIVSTGWDNCRIYQIGNNGYTPNSGYQLRLVQESNTVFTLEIKNNYGYNGAKTVDFTCKYIMLCNATDNNVVVYKSFTPSSGKAEVVKITTSPNYMVGFISKALKDSEGNIIKDTYLPLSGGTMTGNLNFSNTTTGSKGIVGTIGDNDFWRIVGNASSSDNGSLELATADGGNEPIVASQYTGEFATRTRRMYLLDSYGDTTIPGELKLENGKRIFGKNTNDTYINLICIDKSNHVNVSHPVADQLVLNARFGNIVACDGSRTYTVYHRGNFNPSDYLPKSGGTLTGALAIEQDKGIVSANNEGGTLLVETNTSVNVGKKTKAINLNCSMCCVNDSQILATDNYMYYMKNIFYVLFERNNGTINKNINTCFDSYSGTFTAPLEGQYLVMCSGYELINTNMYVACVVGYERSNRNKLYTTGSSGFTLITLSEKETLSIYACPTGNITNECVSSKSLIDMLIAKIL